MRKRKAFGRHSVSFALCLVAFHCNATRCNVPAVVERIVEKRGEGPFVSRRGLHALVLFGGLSWACGGPQFTGRVYRDEEVAFRLGPIPPGLVQLKTGDARLAFRNDEAGTTWAIKARCGLDGDDVPLDALVKHLFLHFTDRKELQKKHFTLDGRAALLVEMEASLDGVMQRFIVVVTKKDSCVYDFVHVDSGGSRLAVVRSRENFLAMVQGFETLG